MHRCGQSLGLPDSIVAVRISKACLIHLRRANQSNFRCFLTSFICCGAKIHSGIHPGVVRGFEKNRGIELLQKRRKIEKTLNKIEEYLKKTKIHNWEVK